MKKIIVMLLVLCCLSPVYSQNTDLIIKIQELTLVNDSLRKQVIKPLQDSIFKLNADHSIEITSLRGQIGLLKEEKEALNVKLGDFNNSIADLSRNEAERDSLQKQIEDLTAASLNFTKLIQDAEEREVEEKRRNRFLTDEANNYTRKRFDDLIKESTKLSVQRDKQLFNNVPEVMLILSDLEKYFDAEELLSKKINTVQIEKMQTLLNPIKHQSTLIDELKENIEYYKDFNDELKKTTLNIIDLDKQKTTVGEPEIQKIKFNEIMSELADYMYNYYEYGNYPYLSDIVLEIIKRKRANADASITDLFEKLQ